MFRTTVYVPVPPSSTDRVATETTTLGVLLVAVRAVIVSTWFAETVAQGVAAGGFGVGHRHVLLGGHGAGQGQRHRLAGHRDRIARDQGRVRAGHRHGEGAGRRDAGGARLQVLIEGQGERDAVNGQGRGGGQGRRHGVAADIHGALGVDGPVQAGVGPVVTGNAAEGAGRGCGSQTESRIAHVQGQALALGGGQRRVQRQRHETGAASDFERANGYLVAAAGERAVVQAAEQQRGIQAVESKVTGSLPHRQLARRLEEDGPAGERGRRAGGRGGDAAGGRDGGAGERAFGVVGVIGEAHFDLDGLAHVGRGQGVGAAGRAADVGLGATVHPHPLVGGAAHEAGLAVVIINAGQVHAEDCRDAVDVGDGDDGDAAGFVVGGLIVIDADRHGGGGGDAGVAAHGVGDADCLILVVRVLGAGHGHRLRRVPVGGGEGERPGDRGNGGVGARRRYRHVACRLGVENHRVGPGPPSSTARVATEITTPGVLLVAVCAPKVATSLPKASRRELPDVGLV